MQNFAVVDLTPQCEVRQKTVYTYELLERLQDAPKWIGWCSGRLWQYPDEFEAVLGADTSLSMRWLASAPSAGILTIRERLPTIASTDISSSKREAGADDMPHPPGRLLTLGLLASGIQPEADRLTLEAFQQHVVHELHDTGYEPGFDLLDLTERPLLATIALATPADPNDRWIAAIIDRCFAASFFRKMGRA